MALQEILAQRYQRAEAELRRQRDDDRAAQHNALGHK
eukprot:gene13233-61613_t